MGGSTLPNFCTGLRELCQCSVRYVSVNLTAIERLRRERMCANSGRTYEDSARTMEKKEAVIIHCSEMRTEGTSRSFFVYTTAPLIQSYRHRTKVYLIRCYLPMDKPIVIQLLGRQNRQSAPQRNITPDVRS